jgi:translation initiation factor IF-2
LGLNDVPQAGDTFVCFDDEKGARSFAETFVAENKIKLVEESKHKVTLDALFDQIKAGELKELNIVLKADVAGSSEAIKNSLEKLSNDEVVVKVIHEGVGNINESDVTLASASNAIIIGFNVKPEANTKSIIEREKVDLRLYNIIYNAIDDVEKAMKGMLAPVFEEKIIGNLTVRQIFKASSVGSIAGSFVNDGEIRRNSKVRLKRGEKVIFDGPILSLKRFKDEVKEVKAGFECGVVLDGFSDYQVDDIMEVYVVEEKKIDYEK